jgi:hypothetical protein
VADPGGGVFYNSGNARDGWDQWRTVSEGSTMPGAPITAVVTDRDHITLLLADPGGGVFYNSGPVALA